MGTLCNAHDFRLSLGISDNLRQHILKSLYRIWSPRVKHYWRPSDGLKTAVNMGGIHEDLWTFLYASRLHSIISDLRRNLRSISGPVTAGVRCGENRLWNLNNIFFLFSRFKLAQYMRTRAWEHNTTYNPPACAFTFSPLHKKYPVRVICKSKCIAFVPRSYIIVLSYNAQY